MKRGKKILAAMLALTMLLGMSTVAFAEENEGGETTAPPSITVDGKTHTDQDTVTIEKIYTILNKGTTAPEETFTVEQVNSSVKDGDAESAPALGQITGAHFNEYVAIEDNDSRSENITITLPKYDTVGVYEYILKETAGKTAGVVYHSNEIKLVVTVMQGDDGKVRVAGVHTEVSGTKTGSIENTYKAAGVQADQTGLRINKTVEGNMGDHDKYFEFTVTLTGETGKTYADSYAIKGGSYTGNPISCAVGTPFKVYLKADETITIENLPYGVTYTVDETDYTDDGYTTTGEVLTAEKVDAATESVTVNNEKGATVDTGINLDSLPYIIVFAVVIVAALATIVVKRRRY